MQGRTCDAAAPAPGTTGSLPLVSPVLQVPPTTTDLADLSSRFPNPAGLPPCLTPSMDRVARHTAPGDSRSAIPADSLPPVFNPIVGITLKEDAGTPSSVRATPHFISDLSTPLSTPTLPFQPPSYKSESPTPMCVDSPPPLLTPLPDRPIAPPAPAEQPITSTVVPLTTTVTASASITFRPPSDQDVTDMDTTPPSQAVTFRSPPGIGVGQTHAAGRPDATRPFVPMGSCRAPVTNSALHSQTSTHPAFAATDGRQGSSAFPGHPSGVPAAVLPGPPFRAPAAIFPGSPLGYQAGVSRGPPSTAWILSSPAPQCRTPASVFPIPPSRVPSTISPSPPSTASGAVFPGPLSRALAVSLSPQIMALGPASPSPPPTASAPVFPSPPIYGFSYCFPQPPTCDFGSYLCFSSQHLYRCQTSL